MIESMTIKSVASFDDSGVCFSDLKKVNYFFGHNGSGKSTIAEYLYYIGLPENTDVAKYARYVACTQKGYDNSIDMLVYNVDYVRENFEVKDELNGIFSLNKVNIEIDKKISEKKLFISKLEARRKYLENKCISYRKHLEGGLDSLVDKCFEKRKVFDVFPKIKIPHSNNKQNNFNNMVAVTLRNGNKSVKTYDELVKQYKFLFESSIKSISNKISDNDWNKVGELENAINNLLQKIIIGNKDIDLADLIDDLNIGHWVGEGRALLDKTKGLCPFCQQKVNSEELKEQLDKYFDKTYESSINEIIDCKEKYITETTKLLNEISLTQSEIDVDSMTSNLYIKLKEIVDFNISQINAKLKSPNVKYSVEKIDDLSASYKKINGDISNNNTVVNNMDNLKKELLEDILAYLANESKFIIDEYKDKKEKNNKLIEFCNNLVAKIIAKKDVTERAMKALSLQTVNSDEAIKAINGILKKTGYCGFEIIDYPNINGMPSYKIVRNNQIDSNVFKSLSEGEKNIIAFLYFYQNCLGTSDVSKIGRKKIIVIDDPVSSLDSQSLFTVASIVNRLTARDNNDYRKLCNEGIEQIFIFTHNGYFNKEVTFNKRPNCKDQAYFLLCKQNGVSKVDVLTKPFHDDYKVMWDIIKRLQDTNSTEDKCVIANIMRRILESYTNFTNQTDTLWKLLDKEEPNSEKYIVKAAFIANINDDSHKVLPTDEMFYQRISNINPKVLYETFKEIFCDIGQEHYKAMMGEQ